jgi:hypothetical protein
MPTLAPASDPGRQELGARGGTRRSEEELFYLYGLDTPAVTTGDGGKGMHKEKWAQGGYRSEYARGG